MVGLHDAILGAAPSGAGISRTDIDPPGRQRQPRAATSVDLVAMSARIYAVLAFGFQILELSMSGNTVNVLALQSPQIIINALAPEFERRSGYAIGHLLRHDDMPVHIRQKIEAGIAFDAAFVVPALMDQLIAEGRVDPSTRARFLRVPIGVAVKAGAPKPDIRSVEAFKQAVLDCGSIAFLKAGTSGPYLDGLFDRFGIAGAVRSKSKRTETDTVGELVAQGEAELGVTAIATLIATPGLDIVGPLPAKIQSYVVFEGAASANAAEPNAARDLVQFVTGPDAAETIRSKGMEPWLATAG